MTSANSFVKFNFAWRWMTYRNQMLCPCLARYLAQISSLLNRNSPFGDEFLNGTWQCVHSSRNSFARSFAERNPAPGISSLVLEGRWFLRFTLASPVTYLGALIVWLVCTRISSPMSPLPFNSWSSPTSVVSAFPRTQQPIFPSAASLRLVNVIRVFEFSVLFLCNLWLKKDSFPNRALLGILGNREAKSCDQKEPWDHSCSRFLVSPLQLKELVLKTRGCRKFTVRALLLNQTVWAMGPNFNQHSSPCRRANLRILSRERHFGVARIKWWKS